MVATIQFISDIPTQDADKLFSSLTKSGDILALVGMFLGNFIYFSYIIHNSEIVTPATNN